MTNQTDIRLWILTLHIALLAICWGYAGVCWGYKQWTWRDRPDKGDGGNGDNPYNYDPDDPQDWWKKENGKAFK